MKFEELFFLFYFILSIYLFICRFIYLFIYFLQNDWSVLFFLSCIIWGIIFNPDVELFTIIIISIPACPPIRGGLQSNAMVKATCVEKGERGSETERGSVCMCVSCGGGGGGST